MIAGGIDPNGPWFRWFACVAYAMLAALIARMILLPLGTLGEASLESRLFGVACGMTAFLASRRRLPVGIAGGLAGFALANAVP